MSSFLSENLNQNKGAPDSWCVLPWSHININGNGTYRLCCHSEASKNRGVLKNDQGRYFRVGNSNWDDVINSDRMKLIRKSMLKGKWPEDCIRCQREHVSGMVSRNIYERASLAEIVEPENYPSYIKAKKMTRSDGSISVKDFPTSFLDIRFGNLCNLKCMMCGPTDSNKWYDDYSAVWGYRYFYKSGERINLVTNSEKKLRTEKNVFDWSENKTLWLQIEKRMHQFRRIYIAGGEPLLIKNHYDFLRKCIERDIANKLIIEYNSNVTHVPKYAWDIWKQFKKIIIGISLDGLGSVNDLIRYPSKWESIKQTLLHLDKEAEGNFVLHIAMTVSVLNIWHLPKFIEYMMQNNYKRIGPWTYLPIITPHPVHRPHYLNINILEDHFKEKIRKRFNDYKEKFRTLDWEKTCGKSQRYTWKIKIASACQILDNYIEHMKSTQYNKEELIQRRSNFIHFMDRLDSLRGTCWEKILPELYKHTLGWRKLPKGDWSNSCHS